MFGYGYRLFGSQISAVQNYTRNYIVAVSSVINRFTSQGSLVSGFCCGGEVVRVVHGVWLVGCKYGACAREARVPCLLVSLGANV